MHGKSVILAFALHSYILYYPRILLLDSEGPDQMADGQADLALCCLQMPEDRFLHGVAQMC